MIVDRQRHIRKVAQFAFCGSLILLVSCGEELPTAAGGRPLGVAGKPAGDPIVNSTDPPEAPRGTTLDVRVLGSGFDNGSVVDLELDGQPSEKIHTNATRYVSSRELVANLTIDPDAPVERYDVAVTTTKGKRGIGIERFAVTEFEAIDLGTLGGNSSFALAINEAGMVMGKSTISRKNGNSLEIFAWTEAGGIQRVGSGAAEDLGENGWIVGASSSWRPGYWEKAGSLWSFVTLPFPSGVSSANARGVRPDGGVIVGNSLGGGFALLWRRSGASWSPSVLPGPSGGSCEAYRVNADEWIAGHCNGRGIVWKLDSGQWSTYPLDPLPNDSSSFPMRMNDTGDIAGWSQDASGFVRGVLWKRNPSGWDAPLFLGTYGGYSQALGINSQGHVVGHSQVGPDTRAFLWRSQGLEDPSSPGHGGGSAYDINSQGWIVGVQGSRATLWRRPAAAPQ